MSPMDIAKRTVFMCHNQHRSLVGKARYSWHPIIFSQCQDLLTSLAQIIILVGRGAYVGFKHRPSYSVFITFFFETQTILQILEISGYYPIQSFKHKSTQSSLVAQSSLQWPFPASFSSWNFQVNVCYNPTFLTCFC